MANGRDYGGKGEPGRYGGRAKTSTKHPYAAIEHRVIDSLAYADLTFSARSLLVLIVRQLSRDNNGHLQATFSYMSRYGFSENTLSRAIGELLAHGIIYRTRSGGYQQGAAQYAVTWLSIKDRQGIFSQGFKLCAWHDWKPAEEKTRPPNLRDTHLNNGKWTAPATPKFEVECPPKIEDIELIPCRGGLSADAAAFKSEAKPTTCQHQDCKTITLKNEFCAKHRHPASAYTANKRHSGAKGTH